MNNSFYPPSPDVNTERLTKVNGKYRIQVIINLLAIVIFFLLYLGMVVGAAYLIKIAILYPLRDSFSTWDIILKVGLVGMAIMFFGFLLKFIFKNHNSENPLHLEITDQEHPKLFQFIKKLSNEVGAPFPKKVFVSHEINASVFYNSTILSLFLPVKKNLLIGLGLVNSVSLDEFKAVLAHEFGHFSQSSMKVGSYVYMANSIIYDMVYERDEWDDLLEKWKRMDVRIAIFGWILSPLIWLVRLLMIVLYQGMNLLHSSLSRQMEYHADLVAVSAAGSNSIINALYKIGLTSESLNFTFSQLQVANDQNIYTNNVFYNHNKCHEYLEEKNESFKALSWSSKVPDPHAHYQLFDEKDEMTSTMYASHPSGFDREKNAKSTFIPSSIDSRSPWDLFQDADQLAEMVTKNLYQVSLEKEQIQFVEKEKVQEFILNELEEITYDERYMNFFGQRVFQIPKEEDYETLLERHKVSTETIKVRLSELWGGTFTASMEIILKKNEKVLEVISFSQSNDKKATIEINNEPFRQSELAKAQSHLQNWIKEDDDWFNEQSEKVYTVYKFLNQLIEPNNVELQSRYTFWASANSLGKQLFEIQDTVEACIQELIDKGQLEEAEISIYADRFFKQKLALEDAARQANTVEIPNLGKEAKIEKLGEYLTRGGVAYLPINSLDYERVQVFREQVQTVIERLNRLNDKNLGFLLKLQEGLEQSFSQRG